MEKDTRTKYWKQVYHSTFGVLKHHLSNEIADTQSRLISDNCTTIIEQACEEVIGDIQKNINDPISDNNACEFNKETLERSIMLDINSGKLSKDQKLKYIAELNKLQDNYQVESDQEYIIEQVSYLCPVCDSERIKLKADKPIPTIFT